MIEKQGKKVMRRRRSGSAKVCTASKLPLSKTLQGTVRTESLNIDGAFLLHNVLTSSECEQIIRDAEQMSFEEASLNLGNGSSVLRRQERKCQRLLLHVENLSSLWERIRPHVPCPVELRSKAFTPCGLNPRLRILKYGRGEYFRKHYDGGHNGSLMTLIIYLSDNFRGGETRFFKGSRCTDEVRPRTGMGLLFFHDRHPLSPLHEGCELGSGTKYALRTDIYFD